MSSHRRAARMSEAAKNIGQALKSRYVLRERLGAGGQGEVWRAFDPQTGVDIALKILQPASGRSAAAWVALVHEHEISARLDHPGILHVYPPERDGATFLLPMELAAGGDLRRLRGSNYLTVVPVLLEVAKALEHAHERGIVHRDLKPGNVLFDARGRVKLADFGVAGRSSDSATGSMRGLSPFTASPEQLRGESPMPADDIYGLGALAYELLSRSPPHYPHFDAERMQREPVPPLVPAQQIPPQLAALVTAMLEKDPRKRPANMRDVIDELDASLNDTLTFDFDTAEPPRDGEPPNRTVPPVDPRPPPPPLAPAAEPRIQPPSPIIEAEAPTPPPVVIERPLVPERGTVDGESLWQQVKEAPLRPRPGLEPVRSSLPRAIVVLLFLAAIAAAAYYWLPHATTATPATSAPAPEAQLQARFTTDHAVLEQRIRALEARGAAIWGGPGFMTAKSLSAEAAGAQATGNPDLARERLAEADKLLNAVDEAAPGALNAQLAGAEQALSAGQVALAAQAYELAARIAPQDERVRAGQARVRELAAAAAQPDEAAPAHGETAFGEDRYAKAAGEGYAALGAGRLSEARSAFERARSLRPDGAEAIDGLKRVEAAERAHGLGSLQTRAEDLEADERWDEALTAYNSALRQNPSAQFAQEGKARAQARLQLSEALQGYIDRPDRLASAQVREEAGAMLKAAEAINSPGPALRLQIARVAALLPEFEKTVRVSLVSDGLTQVSIPEIGNFGGFARRDVELKPGHYTVIGTREGYREVRRDLTVSPGQPPASINVICYDPS
ncbi:MAG: protein kinase [Proteobacteria bacterium]|nr:protein kinase [Pseudomonadota bacterium]